MFIFTTFSLLYLKLTYRLNYYALMDIFIYSVIIFLSADIAGITIRKKMKNEAALNEHKKKIDEIMRKYVVLNKSFEELTVKFLMIKAKVMTAMNDFKELIQFEEKSFFYAMLEFYKKHNYVLESAFFLKNVENDEFVLQMTYGFATNKELKKLEDYYIVQKMFKEKKMITVKDILKESYEKVNTEEPIIAVPFMDKNQNVIGVLLIFNILYFYMTNYNINMIFAVSKMLEEMVYEKFFLPEASYENEFFGEIGITSGKYFYDKVYTYLDYVKMFPGYSFGITFIKFINLDDEKLKKVLLALKNSLFHTDFIAVLDTKQKIIGICLNLIQKDTINLFFKKINVVFKEFDLTLRDYRITYRFFDNSLKNYEIPTLKEIKNEFNKTPFNI
jgi:uncharacterized protein YerC